MKLAVLFSGGKDSSLALHKVLKEEHDVEFLLNIISENEDSFMFHKQDFGLLEVQVERLGIDMISIGTKGEKEKELDDLRKLIGQVKDKVDGIVVGGIASSYQGTRVKKICDEFGLEFVAPLLGYEPERLWRELIDSGFEVIMIKIACDGLGKEWLGRVIDNEALSELRILGEKYKFRLDFEGGEAESSVLNMPEYSSRIDIDFDVVSEGECRHLMRDVVVR
ncbi:diphthine--ammonia ligase [archaeon]|jgi:diphthine-ammonia ligase|nr:diphthine--ammonia ligase [archaeon]MBT7128996.1 diphthine--ammonia ligase [archaeon]